MNPSIRQEFEGLLNRLSEDALTPTDLIRFNDIFADEPEARRMFVTTLSVDGMLYRHPDGLTTTASEAGPFSHTLSGGISRSRHRDSSQVRKRKAQRSAIFALAAVIFMVALPAILWLAFHTQQLGADGIVAIPSGREAAGGNLVAAVNSPANPAARSAPTARSAPVARVNPVIAKREAGSRPAIAMPDAPRKSSDSAEDARARMAEMASNPEATAQSGLAQAHANITPLGDGSYQIGESPWLLKPLSDAEFQYKDDRLQLNRGEIRMMVKAGSPAALTIPVMTPAGEITGTAGQFAVSVSPDPEGPKTRVAVLDGTIGFKNQHGEARGQKNDVIEAVATQLPVTRSITPHVDTDFIVYRRIASKTTRNVLVNPGSITTTIGMLFERARGRTASELAAFMHMPLGGSHFIDDPFVQAMVASQGGHKLLSSARNVSKGKGTPAFRQATCVYMDRTMKNDPSFAQTCNRLPDTIFRRVDFLKQGESVRLAHNQWVSDTFGKEMVDTWPPGLLGPTTESWFSSTCMVTPSWPFSLRRERGVINFQTMDGLTIKTEMLVSAPSSSSRITVLPEKLNGSDYYVVRIPMMSQSLTMLMVLPHDHMSLHEVEKALSAKQVKDWLRRRPVQASHDWKLVLPEVDIVSNLRLDRLLAAEAPSSMDPQAAPFDGLFLDGKGGVSGMNHAAQFILKPQSLSARGPVRRVPVKELRFDRPFLSMMVDTSSARPVFIGRITEPYDSARVAPAAKGKF